jgi:hypothetical protein
MADFLRQLRDWANRLTGLYQDIDGPVLARREWLGTTFARRTLGDGVPVELWYLAEYFLLFWHDWHGLRQRFLAYFGQADGRFPRSWNILDHRCQRLANRLLQEKELDGIIADSWLLAPASEALARSAKQPEAKSVYHAIVLNHRRISLLVTANYGLDRPRDEFHRVVPLARVWPKSLDTAERLNSKLIASWDNMPGEIQEETRWHLRQYGHAQLLASWLLADTPLATDEPFSALLYTLNPERIVTPTVQDFIGSLRNFPAEQRTVAQVLERMSAAIGDFGYKEFVDDVTSGDFLPGPNSPLGSDAINLIPSKHRGPCRTVLVAVSRGIERRSGLGFPKIMSQVKAHLIDCKDTRAVIFLCDHWSPDILEDHLDQLRAEHRRGVRFLFLLAGLPDRAVAPVVVDLGATP